MAHKLHHFQLTVAFSFALLCSITTAQPSEAQTKAKASEKTLDRRLVLTFDDLPYQGPSATFRGSDRFDISSLRAMNVKLVAALVTEKVTAIGFVNEGKLVGPDGTISAERTALLEEWLKAGFELGNHTYSHNSLNRISLEDFQADLLRGEQVTKELAIQHGQPAPRYLRHPFLHTGRTGYVKRGLAKFLADRHYTIAPVTIDNAEWIFAKAYALALSDNRQLADKVGAEYLDYMMAKTEFSERQSRELLGREIPQILLLHDNRLNADLIGALIARYRDRGYSFIELDEALEDPAFQRPDGYFGPAGISWIERWAFAAKRGNRFFAGGPSVDQWVLDLAQIESE